MSDYFFYDLNKKMADLASKQQLTEDAQATPAKSVRSQLNERDMGKHNNATTGFAALAKKTGGGEKGAKIAGAQLAKMRAKGQVEESPENKYSNLSNRGVNRGINRAGDDFNRMMDLDQAESPHYKTQHQQDTKQRLKTSPMAGPKGQLPEQGVAEGVSNIKQKIIKLYKKGLSDDEIASRLKIDSDDVKSVLDDYKWVADTTGKRIRKTAREGNAFSGAVVRAKADGIQPGEKINVGGKQYPVKEQGAGIPTTPKQKAFAKLAPPVDKITFADKIVGAKKEVDEMLGDVAAMAMKKAVGRNRDMEEGHFDDTPTRRRSSSGGEIDTSEPGVTRHRPVKGNYSGANHSAEERRAQARADADDERGPRAGRRTVGAGMGKKIGAKINTGKSKLMTREGDMDPEDQGEYDQEGSMAKDDIKTVVRHAQALEKILGDNDNLPEWVQAKLAKIEGMMTAVDDYMQNQQDNDMGSDDMEMDEESTNTRNRRAERAGRKVAKDIEYDEKKTDGIHGKRRGSEDDKAEKAGKKVAKDIEYDEKVKEGSGPKEKQKSPFVNRNSPESKTKIQAARDNTAKNTAAEPGKKLANKIDNKKKEVDETTSSGSVATSSAAPKSGGGMSYGKGIYDSMNREVEKMISESMSINMSMNNDSHGGPSNTLTVTATDEDALQLAMLLKSAGLGSQEHNDMSAIHNMDNDMSAIHDMDHDHGDETCPACGSSECECDSVDEAYGDTDATQNEPDWPTDQEGTDDAMMYSGGLDGPKSTGQTTIPIVGGQDDRMGYAGTDALRRMMEMAGLSEAAATPQDMPKDPPTKPAAKASAPKPATTKPPVKLATPQAVDEPVSKVKESLLMQLRNFKY